MKRMILTAVCVAALLVTGVAYSQDSNPNVTEVIVASQSVNVNSADAKQLDTIPGVGPVLAERIVAYREANGEFKALDELTKVKGIGVSTVEKIKNNLSL